MGRPGGPGPLDPIFDVETQFGAVGTGNTPGITPLTVTINQAAGQDDPTSTSPILFTAVFSEPVTGFTDADAVITGTAGATAAVVTEVTPFDGTTYEVSVDMTSLPSGTVIANIPSGVVTSIATGIGNAASSSTDNVVTWEGTVIPTTLTLIGWVTDTAMNGAVDVAVSGNYAFVVNSSFPPKLSVCDVTDPTTPTFVTSVAPANNGQFQNIIINGTYAYVADPSRDGIQVFDVTTPTSPTYVTEVRNATTLNGLYDLVQSGNYVFCSALFANRFIVLDVSTASAPTIASTALTHADLNGECTAIDVAGNYAFVANRQNNRLIAVDISTPTSPAYVGVIQDNTYLDGITDVKVSGNYAFCSVRDVDSMTVVDISNPASMSIVTNIFDATKMNNAYALRYDSGYVYMTADANPGYVTLIDATNPASLSLIDDLTDTKLKFAEGIHKVGDLLYIAGHDYDGLLIVEIT